MRTILVTMIIVALGAVALWAGTVPTTMDRDAQFAGSATGCRCSGTTAGGSCSFPGCSGTITTCDVSDTGAGHCSGAGNDPCVHNPGVTCAQDAICS